MVAFQARVVGQDLARGQAERGAAQAPARVGESITGARPMRYALQLAAQFRPVLLGGQEMAAIGHQRAHLVRHAPAEVGIAAGEGDDHGLGVFAEQAEDPLLEPLVSPDGPRGPQNRRKRPAA